MKRKKQFPPPEKVATSQKKILLNQKNVFSFHSVHLNLCEVYTIGKAEEKRTKKMMYYKILPKYENKNRSDGSILIANELYTEKELERFRIPKEYTKTILVPKTKTEFFFGARFSSLN